MLKSDVHSVSADIHQIYRLMLPRYSRLIKTLVDIGVKLNGADSRKVYDSVIALDAVENSSEAYSEKWKKMIDENFARRIAEVDLE